MLAQNNLFSAVSTEKGKILLHFLALNQELHKSVKQTDTRNICYLVG